MKNLIPILIATVLPSRVLGATVFDTFGPGNSFDQNTAKAAGWNPNTVYGKAIAASFAVNGGDYTLGSVTLALGYVQDTSKLMISIVRDNAGTPTGPVVETVASNLAAVTNSHQVVTFESSLNPVMAGGGKFWLLVEPPAQNLSTTADNSAYEWYATGMFGPVGLRDFDFGSGNWLPWQLYNSGLLPAFRIEATLVPEPSTLALALAGAVGLVGLRFWRRFRHTEN